MKHLLASFILIALSSASVAQLPDFDDPDVELPRTEDLSTRPQVRLHIGEQSEFIVEGVHFSTDQITALLKSIKNISPTAVINITIENKATFKHLRAFQKLAGKLGYADFTMKVAPLKTKQENKALERNR